jgi:hypothetical protein
MAADGTPRATSGHGSRAGKREQAIIALITSRTHRDAATACGIGLRTLQKWLTEPAFAEAYARAKRELIDGTTSELRNHGTKAVATLARIASDTESPAAAQVSAASRILEFLYRSHEDEDISARLDKLEAERNGDSDGDQF